MYIPRYIQTCRSLTHSHPGTHSLTPQLLPLFLVLPSPVQSPPAKTKKTLTGTNAWTCNSPGFRPNEVQDSTMSTGAIYAR